MRAGMKKSRFSTNISLKAYSKENFGLHSLTGGDIYGASVALPMALYKYVYDCDYERGARAYNGGLGAEPPAGSRAEPLVRGGRSRHEADSILAFER